MPREERGKNLRDLALDEDLPAEKALGVRWIVETDTIGFAVSDVSERPCTRRGMLAILGSVYDPLGMAAPLVLYGRLILQELTRRQYGWDDLAPEGIKAKWAEWREALPLLAEVSLPRCLRPEGFERVRRCEIHHFSDASSLGYGVVSYLRLVSESGQVHCSFIFGKARVLPVKGMTIPRAELTAATLAARIDLVLRRALQIQIDDSIFWTDSTTVIRYIRNEHTRFHTFVSNRLAVIRDASCPRQWRHVESSENPGDSASRGQAAAVFANNQRWFRGPSFLLKESGEWPQAPEGLDDVPEQDVEVKRTVMSTIVKEDRDPLLVLFSYYSSWYRLRRAVVWILRVKNMLRDLAKSKTNGGGVPERKLCDTPIAFTDLQEAESAVLSYVQRLAFPGDVETLLTSGSVKSTSCLARLDPFLKGDIVRVGGRMANATASEDQKHPVILPKRHHVVDLIIQQVHEDAGHAGREHVLARLRGRYWHR